MKVRDYQMTKRADDAQRTSHRILDAALTRYAALPYSRLRLEDIALDAGVTVQTVIRRFGGKPGLITSLIQRELGTIAQSRAAQQTSDPRALLHDLVVHYERYGDLILKVYAEAAQIDGAPELAAAGRAYHVGWCRDAFADRLGGLADARDRERRLAQLTAICDATTWRILRREAGLDIDETELALSELLVPLLPA